jgi:2-oxoisovalerate dehydrogenase E2 component (dihydrolipoyl transacylase)
VDFPLPQMGEGLYEVELIEWKVKPGDAVTRGQGLMEVMSDKATMEVPAPFAGKVTALKGEPGQKIRVGEVILSYETSDSAMSEAECGDAKVSVEAKPAAQTATTASKTNGARAAAPTPATEPKSRRTAVNGSPPPAAPSVRQMARKLGLDLHEIRGSGPGGRILMDDLATFVKQQEPLERPPAHPDEHPEFGVPGTRIKYQGMRRRIGEHLTHSKHTAPHYTYVDECEVTEMVKVRKVLREPFAKQGVKLTYLAFFVKAAGLALKEVPIVNSSLDEASGEIVLHDKYNVGVAVATRNGLMVPVVRDADKKDLAVIAHDIERLSSEARANRIKVEDLRGGTFTVSSVGNIGGLISTPIINYPEVGILGIGKSVRRAMYDANGNIYPADVIFLSLSFDHRVVDGAAGARFLDTLASLVEEPAGLVT